MEPLKLYVWEGVLKDHTDGIMFALAPHVVEARRLIYKKIGDIPDDLILDPREITEPEGFFINGGG